jgi:tetratricopeptide (TPR) repeat protein
MPWVAGGTTRVRPPQRPLRASLRLCGTVIGAAAILSTCGPRAIPELPRVDTSQFLPAARETVEAAYAKARSRPGDAEATGQLGMSLHAHGQHAAAALCYERARRLDPKAFRWRYLLGVVLAADGHYQEAAEAFRRALRLRPDYVPARLRLAEVLLASGNLSGARKLYEAVVRSDPNQPAAHYGLGRVRAAEGRLLQAAESFREACRLFPAYGSAHYALARTYQQLGRPDQATPHLEAYERHKTDVPPALDEAMEQVARFKRDPLDLIRRATEADRAGDLETAVRLHEEALRLDPDNAQAHANLVTLYGRLHRYQEAERHYRAAVARNPNLAESHYNYGVICFLRGRRAEARDAFRRTLAINPHHAEARHNYGYLLEEQGRLAEAAEQYRRALDDRPGYQLAHYHLARILAHWGRHEEAIRHLEATLEPENENTPGYLYALAAAYARLGRRDQALFYARQARDQAAARGQTQLAARIARDLAGLEQAPPAP